MRQQKGTFRLEIIAVIDNRELTDRYKIPYIMMLLTHSHSREFNYHEKTNIDTINVYLCLTQWNNFFVVTYAAAINHLT